MGGESTISDLGSKELCLYAPLPLIPYFLLPYQVVDSTDRARIGIAKVGLGMYM